MTELRLELNYVSQASFFFFFFLQMTNSRQNQFKENGNVCDPITKMSKSGTKANSRRSPARTRTMRSAYSIPLYILTHKSLCLLHFQTTSPIAMSECLQQIQAHGRAQPRPAGRHKRLLPSSPRKSLSFSFCWLWVTSFLLKESLQSEQCYALNGQAQRQGCNNPGCF